MVLGHGINESPLTSRIEQLEKDEYDKRQVETAPYYDQAETGLVHPWTTSIVKLRDNGNIDIFTSTDNGIRLSQDAKTITMFASGVKEYFDNHRSWITKDSVTDVKGTWKLSASTIDISGKTKVSGASMSMSSSAYTLNSVFTEEVKKQLRASGFKDEIINATLAKVVGYLNSSGYTAKVAQQAADIVAGGQ